MEEFASSYEWLGYLRDLLREEQEIVGKLDPIESAF